MTPEQQPVDPEEKVDERPAVKKKSVRKAAAKKKAPAKKKQSVTGSDPDTVAATRAAIAEEAAQVHAAEEMQRRYRVGASDAKLREKEPGRRPPVESREPRPEQSAARDQPPTEQSTQTAATDSRPEDSDATTDPADPPASKRAASDDRTSGEGRTPGRRKWKDRKRDNPRQRSEEGSDPDHDQSPPPLEPCNGMTEIAPKGFGFLRTADKNFVAGRKDVFVPPEFVRKYTLRDGMLIEGECRRGRRGPHLVNLHTINGVDPEKYVDRPLFEELKAVNPDRRYLLETDKGQFTTRVIDMMSPIGRGQRGLIVAPPRTGKTTILEHIAQALDHNHPDVHVIVLLIDERPEEVTQMKRVLENAEILSSSNDSNVKNHVRIAELAIERAKRLVEAGEHVVVLLDSITRLGRAFNNAMKGGGRTMSGGIDIRALELPRRLFAAARNTREGGSLTIIATALVETGSKMDELIFQEFKGTGNMELVLDRKIAQQYVYPAIDIFRSGTRREELLLPEKHLDKIYRIRRGLAGHRPNEAIERLLHIMGRFPSNAQMLLEIPNTY